MDLNIKILEDFFAKYKSPNFEDKKPGLQIYATVDTHAFCKSLRSFKSHSQLKSFILNLIVNVESR